MLGCGHLCANSTFGKSYYKVQTSSLHTPLATAI
ncbi:unnamed protein product [Rhodiola kirilowii]